MYYCVSPLKHPNIDTNLERRNIFLPLRSANQPHYGLAAILRLRLLYRLQDQLFSVSTDIFFMPQKQSIKKRTRCAYIMSCYLADELKCFGYKTDCALYQKSNGEFYSQARFDQAMDELIKKTRDRHDKASS